MRILCAMSGGVDSSTAAHLLVEGGHEVVGVFLRNGVEGADAPGARGCCSIQDARDAARVADRLGIPFHVLDYRAEFAGLIEDFVAEYARGRTPNPCVHCNHALKFGRLFALAEALGAEAVATGHYARLEGGRLLRARDPQKDQSYYLFGLDPGRLARIRFPLGGLCKTDVRRIAAAAGLPTAEKPESQEICFVPGGDYRRLLARRGRLSPGRFVDLEGRDLGPHQGYEAFTIGQRRGLPALGRPAYVVAIRPERREVVVGPREALAAGGLEAAGLHWLGEAPRPGARVEAQIRARHRATPARITALAGDRLSLAFEQPQDAVTPGQAVVLYRGDLVLGGGWIEAAVPRVAV